MLFEELNVKSEIVKALKEMGITEPTLIQTKAIPLIKEGKDLVGRSKTGSGKTLAFGVPLLEKIVPNQGIQVLIVVPTRELVVQISQELRKFGKYLDFFVAPVFGGVSINPQMDDLAQADIVVGTPGRLLDHLQRGTIDLSRLKCAVLDEADKMVEMGFIEDIEIILNNTPSRRQMLLFGATISNEIEHLQHKYMHEPVVAEAETYVEEDFLKQFYYNVPHHEKFSLLVHLLKKEQAHQIIIFCSSRSTVELVAKNLRLQGIKAELLHGKLSQNRRLFVLENFKKAKSQVLVASAVAARGLDIKDVTHIINYDLSQDPQEYTHRIGRTARAGESGKAITLLSEKDYDVFNSILRHLPVKVQELPDEQYPKLHFDARRQESRFGGFRSRNSGHGGFGRKPFGERRQFGARSNSFGQNRFGGNRNFNRARSSV